MVTVKCQPYHLPLIHITLLSTRSQSPSLPQCFWLMGDQLQWIFSLMILPRFLTQGSFS